MAPNRRQIKISKKNSLIYFQTSLVLSDAVWVKTLSPKLVKVIAFAWAFQTNQFKNFDFCFFDFISAKSKIPSKGQ
jgi:hypothetical protein